MKRLLLLVGMLAMPSFAAVSANVAFTSDYVWRGMTQSDGPAIQGGFDGSGTVVENYLDLYFLLTKIVFFDKNQSNFRFLNLACSSNTNIEKLTPNNIFLLQKYLFLYQILNNFEAPQKDQPNKAYMVNFPKILSVCLLHKIFLICYFLFPSYKKGPYNK